MKVSAKKAFLERERMVFLLFKMIEIFYMVVKNVTLYVAKNTDN